MAGRGNALGEQWLPCVVSSSHSGWIGVPENHSETSRQAGPLGSLGCFPYMLGLNFQAKDKDH